MGYEMLADKIEREVVERARVELARKTGKYRDTIRLSEIHSKSIQIVHTVEGVKVDIRMELGFYAGLKFISCVVSALGSVGPDGRVEFEEFTLQVV